MRGDILPSTVDAGALRILLSAGLPNHTGSGGDTGDACGGAASGTRSTFCGGDQSSAMGDVAMGDAAYHASR